MSKLQPLDDLEMHELRRTMTLWHNRVTALGFTLSRRSPNFLPHIADEEMVTVLRQARGRYGTTLEYMVKTADALHARGMLDRELARLVRLARDAGLD